jgi:cytidine deaminase
VRTRARRASVDDRLVTAAVAQMEARQEPGKEGGAAAMYLDDGEIVTGIAFDPPNVYAGLCHETGALLEAHRRGRSVTASVCVCRPAGSSEILILPPCGVCQERLFAWGPAVEVAVPGPDERTPWISKPLFEVAPHFWATPFADEIWPERR